jgi:hypothetical protein
MEFSLRTTLPFYPCVPININTDTLERETLETLLTTDHTEDGPPPHVGAAGGVQIKIAPFAGRR